jgi:hypothetical protein
MPLPTRVPLTATLSLVACGVGALAAEDTFFVGPRALGMAGAQTASVNDVQAQYYNPAAFGFFGNPSVDGDDDNNGLSTKSFGLGIDMTAGGRFTNDFASYAEQLKTLYDNGTITNLQNSGVTTQAGVTSLIQLANSLGNIATPGQGAEVDVNGGVGMRIGHFGIGARIYAQESARVSNLDLTNVGLGQSLNNGMSTITPANNDSQTLLFSQSEITQLENSGLSPSNIQKLDFLARQAGVSSSQAAQLANVLSAVSSAGNSSTIANNTSAATVYGFAAGEIPISYGQEIYPHISIGTTLRLIVGRVYGTTVMLFQNNVEDALRNSDHNYKQSINYGIDVGAMARYDMVNVGIEARNLNAPDFKGPTINGLTAPDYKLSPQVTVGAAFIPWKFLTLEADLDLTTNQTALPDYDTRNASVGAELNIFNVLALRGGLYRNLANDEIGNVVTAGVGLNLWLMRLDAAGSMALQRTDVDGTNLPRELRGSLQLLIDF